MNQYYAIYGNKVEIIDENENKTTREVTNNFHKILIKENEKEEMEKQLEIANKTIEEAKRKLKKLKMSKLLPLGLFALGISLSPISALIRWDWTNLFYINLDICIIFAYIGSIPAAFLHFLFLEEKKYLHTAELQAYFLEKEIPIKEQELENLKQNDKELETPIEQLGMEKVEDRETLLKLKEYLERLEKYGEALPKQANKYAKGLWSEEDRENVQNDGIDADLFEQYLNEYNIRKLMKGKRAS